MVCALTPDHRPAENNLRLYEQPNATKTHDRSRSRRQARFGAAGWLCLPVQVWINSIHTLLASARNVGNHNRVYVRRKSEDRRLRRQRAIRSTVENDALR